MSDSRTDQIIANRYKLLFQAIYMCQQDATNWLESVKSLLENGIDVNSAIHLQGREAQMATLNAPANSTLLHLAVALNLPTLVTLLLQLGANPNSKWPGPNNNSLLHFLATSKNFDELIEPFLAAGADPMALNLQNQTPIEYAANHSRWDKVLLLLQHAGKKTSLTVLAKILFACSNNLRCDATTKAKIFNLLLELGTDVNLRLDEGEGVPHLLHDAVSKRNLELLNVLLDHKANPALLNDSGKTALEIAAELANHESKWKIITTLIQRTGNQTNPELLAKLFIPFITSAPSEQAAEIADAFLSLDEEHKANPNNLVTTASSFAKHLNAAPYSLLHFAVASNNLALANLLLAHHIDPNLPNANGLTAIELAASLNRWEFVESQLERIIATVNPSALIKIIAPCIESAPVDLRNRLLDMILKAVGDKIDLNKLTITINGKEQAFYPLHAAVRVDDPALTETLLKHGANPSQENDQKIPAIIFASNRKAWSHVTSLLENTKHQLTPTILGQILLFVAVKNEQNPSRIALVAQLIAAGADITMVIPKNSGYNDFYTDKTAFQLFSWSNSWDCAALFIDHLTKDMMRNEYDSIITNALLKNTPDSNTVAAKLISLGVDPNYQRVYRHDFPPIAFPLQIAIDRNDIDLFRSLLAAGANLCLKNNAGLTPIEMLAYSEKWELILEVLNAMEKLDSAKKPTTDILGKVLWEAVAKLPNMIGPQPAVAAAPSAAQAVSSEIVIRPLLKAKAKINTKIEKSKYYTLDLSIAKGHPSLTALFVSYGAKLDAENHAHQMTLAIRLGPPYVTNYNKGIKFAEDFLNAKYAVMMFYIHRKRQQNSVFNLLPLDLLRHIEYFAFGELFQLFRLEEPAAEKTLGTHDTLPRAEISALNFPPEIEILEKRTQELVDEAAQEAPRLAAEKLAAEQRQRHAEEERIALEKRRTEEIKAKEKRLADIRAAEVREADKRVSKFSHIYAALLEPQPQKKKNKNFLNDKKQLTSAELIPLIKVEKKAHPHGTIKAAWKASKKYKDQDCSEKNIDLVLDSILFSFSHQSYGTYFNFFGTNFYRTETLKQHVQQLSASDKKEIASKIAKLDLNNDTSPTASIVRMLKRNQ